MTLVMASYSAYSHVLLAKPKAAAERGSTLQVCEWDRRNNGAVSLASGSGAGLGARVSNDDSTKAGSSANASLPALSTHSEVHAMSQCHSPRTPGVAAAAWRRSPRVVHMGFVVAWRP